MNQYDVFATLEQSDVVPIDRALKERRLDVYGHLLLMHALDCRNESSLARVAHKAVVHQKGARGRGRFSRNIVTDSGGALDLMGELGLVGIGTGAVDRLPEGSAVLEFEFELEKDYLSRDDEPFYPIENPVRKDWVFRAPMVSGASWKGSMRAAAVERWMRSGCTWEDRLALVELFGDEKGEAEEEADGRPGTYSRYLDDRMAAGDVEIFRRERRARLGEEGRRKGRLRILPSFFNGVDLEVLNPRSRRTRAGTVPVMLEVVPAGCRAKFGMIYVPFDLLGKHNVLANQAKRDWKLIGEALVWMMRRSGFGAKKSSGCGKARPEVRGFRFESRVRGFQAAAVERIEQMEKLGDFFEVAHEF